jgi:hypothetical protein
MYSLPFIGGSSYAYSTQYTNCHTITFFGMLRNPCATVCSSPTVCRSLPHGTPNVTHQEFCTHCLWLGMLQSWAVHIQMKALEKCVSLYCPFSKIHGTRTGNGIGGDSASLCCSLAWNFLDYSVQSDLDKPGWCLPSGWCGPDTPAAPRRSMVNCAWVAPIFPQAWS